MEFHPQKDIESIYSLFTKDREAFFEWEKKNPDLYLQSILAFIYQDDHEEAVKKYQEYLDSDNKEVFRLKFYLTLQLAFDQEIKRRGLSQSETKMNK